MKQTITAPWDGRALGEVELADETIAERAIVAAERAFDAVRAMPTHARRDALRKSRRRSPRAPSSSPS